MELKKYQRDTLAIIERYLRELVAEKENGEKIKKALPPELLASLPKTDYTETAWDKVTNGRTYYPKKNGLGENIADFYIKLPTGGGKTLLACHTIDLINRTYLKKQTGVVLWIVPTQTIYAQTLKAISDRAHPYRQVLDIASAGRTIICEKTDRFSREDVEQNLVVMLLMLPSANRLNKDVLRMFKDNGGFMDFFPLEDDIKGNEELINTFPNLDYFGQEDGFFGKVAKTSLGNTLKILKPIIIIDEGHKAYSGGAQRTILDFNPSIIIELSATPPENSNKLVEILGKELEAEGMIKLDLHVNNKFTLEWQGVLKESLKKRQELEDKAKEYEANTGIYIRPICLIQVERTGAEQRGAGYIHSEEVREYLIKYCGAKPEEVAVKSSEINDIEDMDLLAQDCQIRFIITKQALQEGWDCPFAYILTVLTNPSSQLSMTQLVGRVLRQPYATKTKIKELDESYVFCNKPNASVLLENIRKGFQDDGMGDIAGRIAIDHDDTGLQATSLKTIGYRSQFKPFEGKIYLPKFVIQEKAYWRDVNYEMDILSGIDWSALNIDKIGDLALEKRKPEDSEIIIGLSADKNKLIEQKDNVLKATGWHMDKTFMTRQLLDIVPNPWVAYELSEKAIGLLKQKYSDELISVNLSFIIEQLRQYITIERDRLGELVFRNMVQNKRLWFFLKVDKGGYALPHHLPIRSDSKQLNKYNGAPIQRSLFEIVPEESINELEKSVALCLDEQAQLLWWYRNMSRHDYFIQGWRKNKIYPDFIFTDKSEKNENDYDTIYVVETKGEQLAGNLDPEYKENVFNYCNQLGVQKEWRELNAEFGDKKFEFHVVYGDEWRNRILQMLN